MIITRENLIRYWAAGPPWEPVPEGYIYLDMTKPGFPDLATLSPAEKDLLRPVLAANPNYLLGAIPMHPTVQ